ncbi:TIGR02450 family Trp-rich protein [Teredinibacter franksiae]|uniref:TIGR02450 family Trp-rich protein n=1 Tax=Teredinibacter franksiae TaxID=2761453 RepID=UPI0016232F91|nr:TIGR02450 family Trp-rich protein [Teredinibacter franksiae]
MNKIHSKKLLGSKWTATIPSNKEKHFIVSEVEFDDEGLVVSCSIEAVMSKQSMLINWHELKNDGNWIHGWK